MPSTCVKVTRDNACQCCGKYQGVDISGEYLNSSAANSLPVTPKLSDKELSLPKSTTRANNNIFEFLNTRNDLKNPSPEDSRQKNRSPSAAGGSSQTKLDANKYQPQLPHEPTPRFDSATQQGAKQKLRDPRLSAGGLSREQLPIYGSSTQSPYQPMSLRHDIKDNTFLSHPQPSYNLAEPRQSGLYYQHAYQSINLGGGGYQGHRDLRSSLNDSRYGSQPADEYGAAHQNLFQLPHERISNVESQSRRDSRGNMVLKQDEPYVHRASYQQGPLDGRQSIKYPKYESRLPSVYEGLAESSQSVRDARIRSQSADSYQRPLEATQSVKGLPFESQAAGGYDTYGEPRRSVYSRHGSRGGGVYESPIETRRSVKDPRFGSQAAGGYGATRIELRPSFKDTKYGPQSAGGYEASVQPRQSVKDSRFGSQTAEPRSSVKDPRYGPQSTGGYEALVLSKQSLKGPAFASQAAGGYEASLEPKQSVRGPIETRQSAEVFKLPLQSAAAYEGPIEQRQSLKDPKSGSQSVSGRKDPRPAIQDQGTHSADECVPPGQNKPQTSRAQILKSDSQSERRSQISAQGAVIEEQQTITQENVSLGVAKTSYVKDKPSFQPLPNSTGAKVGSRTSSRKSSDIELILTNRSNPHADQEQLSTLLNEIYMNEINRPASQNVMSTFVNSYPNLEDFDK